MDQSREGKKGDKKQGKACNLSLQAHTPSVLPTADDIDEFHAEQARRIDAKFATIAKVFTDDKQLITPLEARLIAMLVRMRR